jgi:AsmA protein
MRTLLRLIKFIFIIFFIAFIAVLALAVTFDANNYKPQIIEQVEKATGRDFAIDGDIDLSVFPWVGLKVEGVTLGNAAGFKAAKFARIEQLDVKVNVLPLLKKEVQINTIRLHGLDVALEVDKAQANNWSDLAKAEDEKEKPEPEDPAIKEEPSAEGGFSLQSLQVEGFEFVDAVINYDDRSSGMKAQVTELNLKTSAIEFDKPVDIEFGARVKNNQPEVDTSLQLVTQLSFNREFTVFNLRDLVFTIMAKANEFLPQDEKIELRSNIDVSMDEQRVDVKQLQLAALDTTTLADVVVTQFQTEPVIQGGIDLQPFNAREVAVRAGVTLPEMAKADALHNVALKTKLKLDGDKLQANDFRLLLDENTMTGWIHLASVSKQQLRYELAFDQLNLNDYLPPVVEAPEEAATPVAGQGGSDVDAEAATGDEKIELPVEMMRGLDIEGSFGILSLKAKEYDISKFMTQLKAKDGDINIKPLSMELLEGQVRSAVNVNVQKDIPTYAIQTDVNQVQVGPVANPFLEGIMGDKPMSMEGAFNMAMDVKTSGETINQLKKASLGQIIVDMKQTSVNGFDPEYYMRSSVASYVDESGFGLSRTIMGSYSPREVTVFDKIHSTVNLSDGKATTDDFLMDSKRVQVTAKGHVDIMENTMDVTTSTKLPRGKTAVEKLLDEPMFVRVHGPFDALQYKIDTDRLKKSTTDVLEKQAKAKIDAEKARLEAEARAKVEAEKQRLKEKADAEKRRAEEKAREELKRSTDKYEDKLKDKLKGLF